MKSITKTALKLIQSLGLDAPLIKLSKLRFFNKFLLKFSWDDPNFDYFYKIHAKYSYLLKKHKIDIKNKTILEIGSGRSIGAGYLFLNQNYKKWIASDPFRTPNDNFNVANKEYKIALQASKINKKVLDYVELSKKEIIFGEKLEFLKLDITKPNPEFNNKFDIILSNAVLEHIPANLMEISFENMFKYLKKGGFMIQEIDLRDHVNVSNPFNFYKYSKSKWEKLTSNTIFYTNRLRLIDYLKIFKKNNLKIISIETKQTFLPRNMHSEIKCKYQDKNLKTYNLIAVLKK